MRRSEFVVVFLCGVACAITVYVSSSIALSMSASTATAKGCAACYCSPQATAAPLSNHLSPSSSSSSTSSSSYSSSSSGSSSSSLSVSSSGDDGGRRCVTEAVPLPGIDHVFVISLPRRLDRWTRMQYLLGAYNIEHTMWAGTDGALLHKLWQAGRLSEFNNTIDLDYGEQMKYNKPPSYGIWALMHTGVRLLRYISSQGEGYGTVLLLEDDVDFETNIRDRLSDIMEHLPDDWGILRLGHCYEKKGERVWGPIYRTTSALCAHAVVFRNKTAADFILKFLDNRTYIKTIANWDQQLNIILCEKTPPFAVYSIFPEIVVQNRKLSSDISSSAKYISDKLQHSAVEHLVSVLQVTHNSSI
ncbi:hypothetical protein Pelo_4394 [Pelomyxa schiedti]|nr:hypothetical protein Pelo_4394 [Pelomyxa schiedti]